MPTNGPFTSLNFTLCLFGLFFGLLFIILGCVTHYLGEKKAVNRLVGFRIPLTFRDPEVWRVVNTRTGLLMVLNGIFLMIVGLILPKVELLVFLLILLLPLAAYITYGTWYAYHLEKQRKRRASH